MVNDFISPFLRREKIHVQPVWKCAGMQEGDKLEMTRLGLDSEEVEDIAWYFSHKGGLKGGHKGGRWSWLDSCFSLAYVLAE